MRRLSDDVPFRLTEASGSIEPHQRSYWLAALAVFAMVGASACTDGEDDFSTTTAPVIVNGGFETGTLASSTTSTFLNPTGLAAVPPTTVAQLQLAPGGTNFTFARTNAVPLSQVPPGLVAGTGVPRWPRFGMTPA